MVFNLDDIERASATEALVMLRDFLAVAPILLAKVAGTCGTPRAGRFRPLANQ